MGRLQSEEQSCRELLGEERRYTDEQAYKESSESQPDNISCKWPLQSLAFVLRQQKVLGCTEHDLEIKELYRELMQKDPQRTGYYQDAMTRL